MTCNVGTTDKLVRLVIGMALIIAGLFFQSWIIGLIAIIPIGTAAMGWCPLYLPIGLRTCAPDEQ